MRGAGLCLEGQQSCTPAVQQQQQQQPMAHNWHSCSASAPQVLARQLVWWSGQEPWHKLLLLLVVVVVLEGLQWVVSGVLGQAAAPAGY
jgi:hypothetical protein